MTKFGSKYGTTTRTGAGPINTTGAVAPNHGGALAYARDAKSDLFMLGVMNFVGEDTFYESADARDERFVNLVRQVTAEDPNWVERFIPWLRNEANMRSASVVAAVEYVKAGGPNARRVIDSACSRADEPAEVLAYWIGVYGRPIPSSVKRGVGDAARRLYNERSVPKYDGTGRKFRVGDVINLVHPKPKDDKQAALFKYALDVRFGSTPDTTLLPGLSGTQAVNKGELDRDALLANPELIKKHNVTWEMLSGLGPMDARAWEAVIPNMGYMALLRNLRNFEQAGISAEATQFVIAKLTNPEEVAKSRQLPFRFWSAYKNVNGLQWAYPLEQALQLSLQNIPSLGGKTLVLTDTSASMRSAVTKNGTISPVEIAAVFGSALALKGEDVDFYGFANSTDKISIARGGSILKAVQLVNSRVGAVGHGTNIPDALRRWNDHDRVILISDMQTLAGFEPSDRYGYSWGGGVTDARAVGIPDRVPVFGFNLCGYAKTQIGGKNQFELGGLTDHTFKMLNLLERGGKSDWPF